MAGDGYSLGGSPSTGEKYEYLEDMIQMAKRAPPEGGIILPGHQVVNSPLVVAAWQQALKGHPDQKYVRLLLEGMKEGFRIGFDYAKYRCSSAKKNMVSACKNPTVVTEYLKKELELGRVIGPLAKGSVNLHVNRFGVIPKPHQPGKWRLIVDMSHPESHSVNDGIEKPLCSLTYASVDEAVALIQTLGKGTLLAKLDLESAYRIIPVHPDDRQLLGMEWEGEWYVDTRLPFGLRSAPKIFTTVADALMWVYA